MNRFFTGVPVFPFGSGLSFTTFAHELVGAPEVEVDAHAVQGYVHEKEISFPFNGKEVYTIKTERG